MTIDDFTKIIIAHELAHEVWNNIADDDFKYFAFMGDTPAETYHIEFRYGADKEGLASYYDGDYAYWLAAGIPADYSEELITDCINLFVDENAPSIAEMFTAEDAAAEEAAAE